MAFKDVVFAQDLSLSSPGFAVLAITDDRQPIILEKSHVKTDAKRTHGFRLRQIEEEMARYYVSYKPTHVVREKGFSRFPAVTQTLFKVVGVSDLVYDAYMSSHESMTEIATTSVKKLVTGNGKASKKDVEKAVIERLQIEQAGYFATDDESDAVAVGLAYMIQKGLID